MNKNYFFLIIILFLSSCQNVKNALSGKKYENSDEFLVIKKNPLVLPPNFNDLPTPKDVADTTQFDNIENEIEDLISSIKDSDEVLESSSSDTESCLLYTSPSPRDRG